MPEFPTVRIPDCQTRLLRRRGADRYPILRDTHWVGVGIVLRDFLIDTEPVFDTKSPVMDTAPYDLTFDATACKRGPGVRAWIVDGVKTIRQMVNPDHSSIHLKGLGFAFGDVCRLADDFEFGHGNRRQTAGLCQFV